MKKIGKMLDILNMYDELTDWMYHDNPEVIQDLEAKYHVSFREASAVLAKNFAKKYLWEDIK